MADTYSGESIVLAKVKGFSPWPAMVIPEDKLPETIARKKPKVNPKKNVINDTIAVRFFNDDSYYWISEKNLVKLDDEKVNEFLGSGKRKDKLLVKAYEMSRDPPTVEDFVKWGSYGEPPAYVEPEEDVLEEEPKKATTKKSRSSARIVKKTNNKKNVKELIVKIKRKPAPKVISDSESDYDSDWGLDDDVEEEEICPPDFPTASQLTKSLSERTSLINKAKIYLLNNLTIDESKPLVLDHIKKLSKVDNLQLSLINKTQVHHVMINYLRSNNEDSEIRRKLNNLIKKWLGFEVEYEEPVEVKDEEDTDVKDTTEEIKDEDYEYQTSIKEESIISV